MRVFVLSRFAQLYSRVELIVRGTHKALTMYSYLIQRFGQLAVTQWFAGDALK